MVRLGSLGRIRRHCRLCFDYILSFCVRFLFLLPASDLEADRNTYLDASMPAVAGTVASALFPVPPGWLDHLRLTMQCPSPTTPIPTTRTNHRLNIHPTRKHTATLAGNPRGLNYSRLPILTNRRATECIRRLRFHHQVQRSELEYGVDGMAFGRLGLLWR